MSTAHFLQRDPVSSSIIQHLHTFHLDTPSPVKPHRTDSPLFDYPRPTTQNELEKSRRASPPDSSILLLEAEMLLCHSFPQSTAHSIDNRSAMRDFRQSRLETAEGFGPAGPFEAWITPKTTTVMLGATEKEKQSLYVDSISAQWEQNREGYAFERPDVYFPRETLSQESPEQQRAGAGPRERNESKGSAVEYEPFSPLYFTTGIHLPGRHASMQRHEGMPVMNPEDFIPYLQEPRRDLQGNSEIPLGVDLLQADQTSQSESELRDTILSLKEACQWRCEPLEANGGNSMSFYERLDSIRLLHDETIKRLEGAANLLHQERKWINMRCSVLYERLQMIAQHRKTVIERLTEVHGCAFPEIWKQLAEE